MGSDRSERVLVVAPIGRDADLTASILSDAQLHCHVCGDVDELCRELQNGAGAVLLTEEALTRAGMATLAKCLDDQPPWSDVPLLILTAEPSLEMTVRSFDQLGRANVTLIDRPIRIKTLISAVQSVLRSRRRQYEVRDLMEALEHRVRERDRFLAILGHELRNPLTAIVLSAQTIDEEDPDSLPQHLEVIERQSNHLNRLVDDLLEISRVTSGKIVLRRGRVSLRKILDDAAMPLQELLTRSNLTLIIDEKQKDLVVNGDATRLAQVATNLLTNAIKYTPAGGTIRATLSREGNRAKLSIADNGVGIAPEVLPKIFDLFTQAEETLDRAQGGMGIGLTLVKNLIELHGGKIEAKSDGVGKGSEFSFVMPLAVEDGVELAPAEAAPRPEKVPSVRIVIVEDNPDVRDLLKVRLKKLGHDVHTARDGQEGLRTIGEVRPDIAILDIGLPGLDGYAVAKKIRETWDGRIVLVAMTGYGQPDDKRKAEEAGFDEHMTKPASIDAFQQLVSRHFTDPLPPPDRQSDSADPLESLRDQL